MRSENPLITFKTYIHFNENKHYVLFYFTNKVSKNGFHENHKRGKNILSFTFNVSYSTDPLLNKKPFQHLYNHQQKETAHVKRKTISLNVLIESILNLVYDVQNRLFPFFIAKQFSDLIELKAYCSRKYVSTKPNQVGLFLSALDLVIVDNGFTANERLQ